MAKRKRSSAAALAAAKAHPQPISPPTPTEPHDDPASSHAEMDASYDETDGDDGEDEEAGSNVVPPVECPFIVEYRSPKRRNGSTTLSKSASRGSIKMNVAKKFGDNLGGPPKHQELDQSFFEDNSTVYSVKPAKQWDALKKYRHFVVGEETFAINDYIFVNYQNIPPGSVLGPVDDNKFWIARVLEIKAVDEAHVYLRVYWFYWPDELPMGRQYYHGKKELIASNHMEIIDAQTVSGRANVNHWFEKDEDEEDIAELFWRQKYDYPTQTLMAVREHCRCHRYYNPDNVMVGCPKCETWLHAECLIEDIKRKVIERGQPTTIPESLAKNDLMEDVDVESRKAVFKRKGGAKGGSLLNSAVNLFASPVATSSKAAMNGKAKKKSKVQVSNEMDLIEVVYNEHTTRAHIKDLRALLRKKAGKSNGTSKKSKAKSGEQDAEDNEGMALEWEEDIYCLACNERLE